MKILIFKSDKTGDFLNISGIIKQLYDKGIELDLICSQYNYNIIKFYNYFNNIYFKENFLKFIIKNKKLFYKKYDLIYQFDGSNWSFYVCSILYSKNKYSIRYIKPKKLFFYKLYLSRPNFFLNFIYKSIDCIEDYNIKNNIDYNYLRLYRKLVIKSGI